MGRIAVMLVLMLVLMGCRAMPPTPQPAITTFEPIRLTATPTVAPPTMTASPTQVPLPTVTPTPTAVKFMDCVWNSKVRAWIDHDADGLRDALTEPPFAGVIFVLEDVYGGSESKVASAATGADGLANLFVLLPGCPAIKFEVYAVVPTGYRAMTSIRAAAPIDKEFEVGFVAEP